MNTPYDPSVPRAIPVEFPAKDNYSVRKRYFLDCHPSGLWYLVESGYRVQWEEWLNDPSALTPDFCKPLSVHPRSIEFELPYTYGYAN